MEWVHIVSEDGRDVWCLGSMCSSWCIDTRGALMAMNADGLMVRCGGSNSKVETGTIDAQQNISSTEEIINKRHIYENSVLQRKSLKIVEVEGIIRRP
jgi:hypothetical protein